MSDICRRLGKARDRLLEATGEYAYMPGEQLDEVTGLRKMTRVRDLQFKVQPIIIAQGPQTSNGNA